MEEYQRSIAIYGSKKTDPYIPRMITLFDMLVEKGFHLLFAEKIYDFLKSKDFPFPHGSRMVSSLEELNQRPVMALSIGGDGTFLKTARWVGMTGIPVLGINAGHLGFLATFSIEDAAKVGQAIVNGVLREEERIVLKVEGDFIDSLKWPYALNEVAILRDDKASMVTAKASIDGFFLGEYVADGLIVSTPTGSTGYNLSVGGPILQPTQNSFVISPIAPHTLTMRPLVVDAESTIEVMTNSRAMKYRLALDGASVLLPVGTRIRITKAPFPLLTLKRSADNFADTLRRKLLWGIR